MAELTPCDKCRHLRHFQLEVDEVYEAGCKVKHKLGAWSPYLGKRPSVMLVPEEANPGPEPCEDFESKRTEGTKKGKWRWLWKGKCW